MAFQKILAFLFVFEISFPYSALPFNILTVGYVAQRRREDRMKYE
jgi:hypothetical protein